jgi:hypothetical protein
MSRFEVARGYLHRPHGGHTHRARQCSQELQVTHTQNYEIFFKIFHCYKPKETSLLKLLNILQIGSKFLIPKQRTCSICKQRKPSFLLKKDLNKFEKLPVLFKHENRTTTVPVPHSNHSAILPGRVPVPYIIPLLWFERCIPVLVFEECLAVQIFAGVKIDLLIF